MSVQVLLSTYNGERYLRPLLESLLVQDYPEVIIAARDDGSSDHTPTILQEYASRFKAIELVCGEHIGYARSFFSLISAGSPTAAYFALCDQDDIWERDKLSRAVAFLKRYPIDVPALYCSRVAIVDENSKPLGYSAIPRKPLSFRNALVECQARGCTVVFNRAARQLLLTDLPEHVCSHDMWIYLVTSAFGAVIYDSTPTMLYRQHAGNVFGVTRGIVDTYKVKIARFLQDWRLHLLTRQAEEFKRIYGRLLPQEHKTTIDRFLASRKSFWSGIRYAFSCDVYRQSLIDQCILRARIAFDCL